MDGMELDLDHQAKLGVEHGPNWLVHYNYNRYNQKSWIGVFKSLWCFVLPLHSQNRMTITIDKQKLWFVETAKQQLSVPFLGPSFIFPSELFWAEGCRIALSLRAMCCIRESMVVRATDLIDLNRPEFECMFMYENMIVEHIPKSQNIPIVIFCELSMTIPHIEAPSHLWGKRAQHFGHHQKRNAHGGCALGAMFLGGFHGPGATPKWLA